MSGDPPWYLRCSSVEPYVRSHLYDYLNTVKLHTNYIDKTYLYKYVSSMYYQCIIYVLCMYYVCIISGLTKEVLRNITGETQEKPYSPDGG